MIPVGGAIVGSFEKKNSESFLTKVAATYAGRASASPAIDLLITSLSMGINGWKKLLKEQKENFFYFKNELCKLAEKFGEKVLHTPNNPISMGKAIYLSADNLLKI